ncbi:mannose-1-phosphate guanylyltransferase [Patescibacteria group bacterium]
MKAVILAGGGGTRLWPLSTPQVPKQFQKITSDKTMIEETLDRLDFLDTKDIYIAFNKQQITFIERYCPNIPEENLIIEPALRDTSSCIGFAASVIEKKHPGEVMAVIYADHLIQNKDEFQKNLKVAEKLAKKENTLNIIEVPATEPNTNYGYVKTGNLLEELDGSEIYEIESFTEKPNKHKAKEFVLSGQYLWNTGIYVWKAETLLAHYEKLHPETYEKFIQMMKFLDTDQESRIIEDVYPTLEKISIDYAIMEKVDPAEIRIIKGDLGWSDIGNWQAIWEELPKDERGNILKGEVKDFECKNCLVYGPENKKIGVIGLEDVIIVDTEDGLLVCKKDQSKRVKEIL